MINFNIWVAQAEYGGWFRVYPMVLFIAFLTVFVISYWRFKMRKIPTRALELSVFVLVLPAIFGASFFGKLNVNKPIPFWELFAFWEPGLSIQGGLIIGIVVGIFWFRYQGKRLQISNLVYLDLILPNVLIGQAIGRWGNFFNHELLGAPVSRSSLDWLPAFIRNNCFKWYIPPNIPPRFLPTQAVGTNGMGVDPNNFSQVQYFSPLFLYESFGDVVLWVVIIFAIPYLWRYFEKIRYSAKNHKAGSDLTVKVFYQKYYYETKIDVLEAQKTSFVKPLWKDYERRVAKLKRIQKWPFWWQWKIKRIKQLWHQDRKKLQALENPSKLRVMRAGLQGASYLFLYNFMRLGLETQRASSDLFIPELRALDYSIIILFGLIGLLLIVMAQCVAPYKWRQWGWLYEKLYAKP